MFDADRQDFGSYVIWDRRRLVRPGERILPRIAPMIVRDGKDAVVLLTDVSMAEGAGTGLELLKTFEGATVNDDESFFYVYRWPKDEAARWLESTRVTQEGGTARFAQ